jgi:hypothetical protein
MGWDGEGVGDGVGGRPAAKERRVELKTCSESLVFGARTLLSILDAEGKGFDALQIPRTRCYKFGLRIPWSSGPS